MLCFRCLNNSLVKNLVFSTIVAQMIHCSKERRNNTSALNMGWGHQWLKCSPCFMSSMNKLPPVLQRLEVFKKISLYNSNFLWLQAEPEIISHRHYGFITMPQTEKSHRSAYSSQHALLSGITKSGSSKQDMEQGRQELLTSASEKRNQIQHTTLLVPLFRTLIVPEHSRCTGMDTIPLSTAVS